jgi:lipopolysaccharide export system permease protein
MLTLLDRHVGRHIFLGTLLVLGVLLALFVFFSLIDGLPDYGKGDFGAYELLRYVVLSQPRKLYEILPTAVLIGTTLGLSLLALNSELVAMRAAGISPMRVIGAAMKVGLLFALAAVLWGEYVVPAAESEAQLGRARAMQTGVQQKRSGLWLRDGRDFVNIGEVLPDLSLLRINVYHFGDVVGDVGRLTAQTSARRAQPEGEDRWRLEDVRQSRFGADAVQIRVADSEPWSSGLTREVVAVYAVKPEGLSMQHLHRYIRHLELNNQSTERYRLSFLQKLFLPLAIAVMVLLATPFVFRPVRGGGLSQRVFIGIMLGLAFIVVNRSLGHFSVLYGLPPLIGAVLPLAIFLSLSLYLLRRAR